MRNVLLLFFIFLTLPAAVYSLPGQHISYTCEQKYRATNPSDCDNGVAGNDVNPVCVKHLSKNPKDNNQPINITMLGDSLTDLVSSPLVGSVPSGLLLLPPSAGDYGIHDRPYLFGKSPLTTITPAKSGYMDSFNDYFANFGGSPHVDYHIDNEGISGWTTRNWKKVLGIAPYNQEKICAAATGKTAQRTLFMIGGNDLVLANPYFWGGFMPFVFKHSINKTVDNIKQIVDWHLENGKDIVLEGNLPAAGLPYDLPLNYNIINRQTLCSGPADTVAKNKPWWSTRNSLEWILFTIDMSIANNKGFSYRHPPAGILPASYPVMGGITMACLNDRIVNEVYPEYQEFLLSNGQPESRVRVFPLYDHFSIHPGNQPNFWVGSRELWQWGGLINKLYPDAFQQDLLLQGFGDHMHLGFLGYAHWAKVLGPKLKEWGWDNPSLVGSDVIDGIKLFTKKPVDFIGTAFGFADMNSYPCKQEGSDGMLCTFRLFEQVHIQFTGTGGGMCFDKKYKFTKIDGDFTPCNAQGVCPTLSENGTYKGPPTLCAKGVLGAKCEWEFNVEVSDCQSPPETKTRKIRIITYG